MMMGIGNVIIELEFRLEIEIMVNRDSIIPSIQSRVDIKCDRNIRVPSRARVNATIRLSRTGVTLVIMIRIII